jgi:hypothetical protein
MGSPGADRTLSAIPGQVSLDVMMFGALFGCSEIGG